MVNNLWIDPKKQLNGEPARQAERKATGFRPAGPDPDNAGGGNKSYTNQPTSTARMVFLCLLIEL
jgi:hypothetical protein